LDPTPLQDLYWCGLWLLMAIDWMRELSMKNVSVRWTQFVVDETEKTDSLIEPS